MSYRRITEKEKQILRGLYTDHGQVRITEHKKSESDRKNPYFLIASSDYLNNGLNFEFTIIWIGKYIWQYRYYSPSCTYKDNFITLSIVTGKQ